MARPWSGERDALIDAALKMMHAEQLRDLIRTLIPWLDDTARARLTNEVVERAARSSNGWAPSRPSEQRVGEIEAFAAAARQSGYSDPSEVDDCLQAGIHAFLARDYAAAARIFRALLIPIGEAEIDLGQEELVDEVLGVDLDACATRYVLAEYMLASPKSRARAVDAAIEAVREVGYFFEPLRSLERLSVEPLPGFDGFLTQWRVLVEQRVANAKKSDWDRREDRWLREVVARTRGPEGLAELARRSRRSDDLGAWCRTLVDAGDWTAARVAYEQAAELVEDREYNLGDFLDGAALAAQELASDDLDATLERAWRQARTMTRLRRWLGGSCTQSDLAERAGLALEAAPASAARQRALLHVLRAELGEAAALLAQARGLGWSNAEHPGYLVFPLFVGLLCGVEVAIMLPPSDDDLHDEDDLDDEDDVEGWMDADRAKLRTPTIKALLQTADVNAPEAAQLRASMIEAMRAAAQKRIEGVTGSKRRRHYDHAASLAVQCARAEGSPEGETWLRELMHQYRRYPALMREFKAAEASG